MVFIGEIPSMCLVNLNYLIISLKVKDNINVYGFINLNWQARDKE